jgi:hypothetical protein
MARQRGTCWYAGAVRVRRRCATHSDASVRRTPTPVCDALRCLRRAPYASVSRRTQSTDTCTGTVYKCPSTVHLYRDGLNGRRVSRLCAAAIARVSRRTASCASHCAGQEAARLEQHAQQPLCSRCCSRARRAEKFFDLVRYGAISCDTVRYRAIRYRIAHAHRTYRARQRWGYRASDRDARDGDRDTRRRESGGRPGVSKPARHIQGASARSESMSRPGCACRAAVCTVGENHRGGPDGPGCGMSWGGGPS